MRRYQGFQDPIGWWVSDHGWWESFLLTFVVFVCVETVSKPQAKRAKSVSRSGGVEAFGVAVLLASLGGGPTRFWGWYF